MGEATKIEWCDHTFNGVRGCAKVKLPIVADTPEAGCHPSGCDHCYAESMSKRNPALLGVWGEDGTRVLASEQMWREPLRWFRDAVKAGRRARVFAYSLGDVFETPAKRENAAVCDEARRRLWPLIGATGYGWNGDLPLAKARDAEWLRANASGGLDWLLLTKRPENIMRLIPEPWRAGLPPNVWVGTSIENRAAAAERIPHLRRVPAAVRFLSIEPLLEDLGEIDLTGIGWVIVGGESGAGARPMHPAWVRSIRDQCIAAQVPFFMKQWGQWGPVETPRDGDAWVDHSGAPLPWRRYPNAAPPAGVVIMRRHRAKHDAGRLLDGRMWDEMPQPAVAPVSAAAFQLPLLGTA